MIWFIGEVTDVSDKLGRVKVRIVDQHDDIDDKDLPLAIVAQSTMSASMSGVGISPHGLLKGSNVIGFYLDGDTKQMPFILCTFNSQTNDKPDVSELAFNEKSEYPKNKVHHTESGHTIEIDDSKDNGRIHIKHRSGTFYIIDNDGTFTRCSVKDDYQVTAGNGHITVKGNVTEKIDGNYTLHVGGNYSVKVGGSTTFDVSGGYSNNVGGSYSIKSASYNLNAGGQAKLKAGVIMLN